MEYLLILLIIPLIPFFVFSTILSAWIFLLGIPFIFFAATITFLRGFLQALFSRTVFPTLKAWKDSCHNMRTTGKWTDGPNPPDSFPQGRTTSGESSRSQTNNRQSETSNNINQERNTTETFQRRVHARQRSDEISHTKSPLLSSLNMKEFYRSYSAELERFTRFITELFFDQVYPTPTKESNSQYVNSPRSHLKEFVETMSIGSPMSPKSQTINEFVESMSINQSPKIVPLTNIFDDLAQALDEVPSQRYYSPCSEQSLFTARTHKSILDDLAEISSNMNNSLMLEDLVDTANDYYRDVSPGDSASQIGSVRENLKDYNPMADISDAAKLLSMFSAQRSHFDQDSHLEALQ
jgi:hypothetical protein